MLSSRRSVAANAVQALRAERVVCGPQCRSISNTLHERGSTTDLDNSTNNRERIVVLGSGWAGYTLARDLDKSKYQVVVVSPRSYFVFTPLLASTSVGTLEFRTALEPVRSRRTNVDFFQGWADRVDFSRKTLTVEEAVQNPHQGMSLAGPRHAQTDTLGENLTVEKKKGKIFDMQYDKLVIAVGCYSQTFNTPGVREHAYFLKDVGDARKIRNRLLSCFEKAALPTTSDTMKKQLLNFAVVGGGPTGIEWSAELHDIIREDMAKLYPNLMKYYRITVYDVAPQVLSMFDDKLAKYAMEHFKREGIRIRTSHNVKQLRRGLPAKVLETGEVQDDMSCFTLETEQEGEVGVGMVVWSTGLMMNPFIAEAFKDPFHLPSQNTEVISNGVKGEDWVVQRNAKSGALITDDHLRLNLVPQAQENTTGQAVFNDIYALGDCAMIQDNMLPATAQVANQKAKWLAKHINKGDVNSTRFTYKDLGVMAYIGNWNAIMQSSGSDISGRFAWFIWRGAYLAKSVSWRNRILIPMYWFINWIFGRDISRF
ncbi:hypothetical protein AAFC00_003793 [Neodothiora populina]|uniref:FAD/NAD(P)-binding domain-containing protein n=1 Tax=Neodothiora populina TaxID=2781224 RepID=A0ABR3PFH8_9PEZI